MAQDEAAKWAHTPELPIQVSPLFQWPIRPLAVLKWFWSGWFLLTEKLVILGIAMISWFWFTPPIETMQSLAAGWIFKLWLHNFILIGAVASALHLWFYTYQGQGKALKYDPRDVTKGRAFTFGWQVWDNAFWTLSSGVAVWTAFEVLMLWALANGWIGWLSFTQNPIWFVAIFFLIPIWESFWFYWIHRALHWRPLYRLAHHLHHRNTDVGPWSGMSMHPVEHVMFLGGVLVHWLFACHPLHIIFHLQYYTLSAVTTHSGYAAVLIKNKQRMAMGTFHHQMHHRYFECNYGSLEIPWDKLFGSFHDGSNAGRDQMNARRKRLAGKLGG